MPLAAEIPVRTPAFMRQAHCGSSFYWITLIPPYAPSPTSASSSPSLDTRLSPIWLLRKVLEHQLCHRISPILSGWLTLPLCISHCVNYQASENPSLFQPYLSRCNCFNHIAWGEVWWGQGEKPERVLQFCYTHSSLGRTQHTMLGPLGKHQDWLWGRWRERNYGKVSLLRFLWFHGSSVASRLKIG